jgi:serine protease Do
MDRKLLARVVAFSLAVMMVLMLVLAPVLACAEYQKVTPQEVCDSIFRIASMDGAGAVTPLGTGFAIGAAAPVSYVVTSNHVVANTADSLVVWMLLDHYVRATVVISLSQADLAVLKLETGINKPPLPLSLADQVTQADAVYAYGFPDYDIHDFNMAYPSDVTVTSGTLSKKTTLNNIGYYQFDASINTGNSGGPLWHADSGGVIGVVAVKSAVSDGINGAVCTEVLIEALDLQNIPICFQAI